MTDSFHVRSYRLFGLVYYHIQWSAKETEFNVRGIHHNAEFVQRVTKSARETYLQVLGDRG